MEFFFFKTYSIDKSIIFSRAEMDDLVISSHFSWPLNLSLGTGGEPSANIVMKENKKQRKDVGFPCDPRP